MERGLNLDEVRWIDHRIVMVVEEKELERQVEERSSSYSPPRRSSKEPFDQLGYEVKVCLPPLFVYGREWEVK